MKTIEITYRYDADEAPPRPRPSDAHEARQRLDKGSAAFAVLLAGLAEQTGSARRIIDVDPRDLGLLPGGENRPPEQHPYATVLGCSDARVPIELIIDEGPNDLFVVRVAGTGLGSEVLGSLKYAIDHLGGSMKLMVVLGHSGCGTVTATVAAFTLQQEFGSTGADGCARCAAFIFLKPAESGPRAAAAQSATGSRIRRRNSPPAVNWVMR